jgi:hypothetical protein
MLRSGFVARSIVSTGIDPDRTKGLAQDQKSGGAGRTAV